MRRLCYVLGTTAFLALLGNYPAYGISYIKEKNGHVIPDFCQDNVNHATAGNDVCMATAYANCLWFFDATDWSGLVGHAQKKWEDDSKALILELSDRMYGNKAKGIKAKGDLGVVEYIRDKGMYYCQRPVGLHRYEPKPTFDNYKTQLQKCEDVILWWSAYTADGKKIGNWSHVMTGAGFVDEPAGKKLKLANPWGPCHDGQPSPENQDFFDEVDISLVGDKMRSTDPDILNRIDGSLGAAYVEVDVITCVSPREKETRVRDGKTSLLNDKARYWYEVDNGTDMQLYEFAVEVQVPFDISSISFPSGWTYTILDPVGSGLFPGIPSNYGQTWEHEWTGIHWYTTSSPILPGSNRGGFSFEYDDLPIYALGEYTCGSALAYGSRDLIAYHVVSGPYIIPEPATMLGVFLGISGIGMYLRKRVKAAA